MEDLYSMVPAISGIREAAIGSGSDLNDLIKAQIASHPKYPSLVAAHIECRKVGAAPEAVALLNELAEERKLVADNIGYIGADPELDEFMECYCRVLETYREELSRPFTEAAKFLSSAEMRLRRLCSEDCSVISGHADWREKKGASSSN